MEQDLSPPTKTLPFQFTGNAVEYFKIWIVNICLSIITLGIYSAWAKVRTKRYFYSNTLLDNTSFEYTGNPVAIVKGRLIAVAFLGASSLAQRLYPEIAFVFTVILLIAFPWLLVRTMRFNARNSSYRNLRFNFTGTAIGAAKVYIGIALLVGLTVGLLFPFFMQRTKKFIAENSAYGTTTFDFAALVKSFYAIYLKVFAAIALLGIVGSVIFFQLSHSAMKTGAAIGLLVWIPVVLVFVVLISPYLRTSLQNLVWNNISIAGNRMQSSLTFGRVAWISISNIFAVILSVGLLAPWAKIRWTRYRIQNLSLISNVALDNFVAAELQQVSAMGEEIVDMFDFDIAL